MIRAEHATLLRELPDQARQPAELALEKCPLTPEKMVGWYLAARSVAAVWDSDDRKSNLQVLSRLFEQESNTLRARRAISLLFQNEDQLAAELDKLRADGKYFGVTHAEMLAAPLAELPPEERTRAVTALLTRFRQEELTAEKLGEEAGKLRDGWKAGNAGVPSATETDGEAKPRLVGDVELMARVNELESRVAALEEQLRRVLGPNGATPVLGDARSASCGDRAEHLPEHHGVDRALRGTPGGFGDQQHGAPVREPDAEHKINQQAGRRTGGSPVATARG